MILWPHDQLVLTVPEHCDQDILVAAWNGARPTPYVHPRMPGTSFGNAVATLTPPHTRCAVAITTTRYGGGSDVYDHVQPRLEAAVLRSLAWRGQAGTARRAETVGRGAAAALIMIDLALPAVHGTGSAPAESRRPDRSVPSFPECVVMSTDKAAAALPAAAFIEKPVLPDAVCRSCARLAAV